MADSHPKYSLTTQRQSKIWLCGQVAANGQSENIKAVVKAFPYFDGAIWTINYSEYNTYSDSAYILSEAAVLQKGDFGFRSLRTVWHNLHSPGMTMFLQCGEIKEGDWVMVIDCQEELKEDWLKNMRSFLADCEAQHISAIYWGRPYIFRFEPTMRYVGDPHCWPTPFYPGRHISIQDESKVVYDAGGVHFGDFLYNKKNMDDTMIVHAFKYSFVYNISNEMQNQYGKFGQEVVDFHEKERLNFRRLWRENLGRELTIESFIDYCKVLKSNSMVEEYIEFENVFKDYYRLKVLRQDRNTVLSNRFKWSLKEYLKTGDIEQKNTHYIGRRNDLNIKYSQPLE